MPALRKSLVLRPLGLLAGFLLLAGASACGWPYNVRPECRAAYDACVNNCADACEERADVARTAEAGDMTDTWSGQCSQCVTRCGDLRENCGR